MRLLSCTLMALLCSTSAFATNFQTKHHFHVGLNTYYRDYSEAFIAPKKSDERGLLMGALVDYEHKGANSFMFMAGLGIDGGKTRYDGALQDHYGNFVAPYKDHTANVFMKLEASLGYTFLMAEKHMLTPFVGGGIKGWGRGLGDVELYSWRYVSGGLQYDYNASEQYQVGLHVKIMPMREGYMGVEGFTYNDMKLGNRVHFEISTPIIYKRDLNSKNYWRFTPYYEHQRFGESNWVNTINTFSTGQIVAEPASRTHIVGLKAEYAFGFW